METRPIMVCVDPETASAYEASSASERRKIDLLINLRLREIVREHRPLEQVIDEIGQKAQKRGLTPEILASILTEA